MPSKKVLNRELQNVQSALNGLMNYSEEHRVAQRLVDYTVLEEVDNEGAYLTQSIPGYIVGLKALNALNESPFKKHINFVVSELESVKKNLVKSGVGDKRTPEEIVKEADRKGSVLFSSGFRKHANLSQVEKNKDSSDIYRLFDAGAETTQNHFQRNLGITGTVVSYKIEDEKTTEKLVGLVKQKSKTAPKKGNDYKNIQSQINEICNDSNRTFDLTGELQHKGNCSTRSQEEFLRYTIEKSGIGDKQSRKEAFETIKTQFQSPPQQIISSLKQKEKELSEKLDKPENAVEVIRMAMKNEREYEIINTKATLLSKSKKTHLKVPKQHRELIQSELQKIGINSSVHKKNKNILTIDPDSIDKFSEVQGKISEIKKTPLTRTRYQNGDYQFKTGDVFSNSDEIESFLDELRIPSDITKVEQTQNGEDVISLKHTGNIQVTNDYKYDIIDALEHKRHEKLNTTLKNEERGLSTYGETELEKQQLAAVVGLFDPEESNPQIS